MAIIEQSSGLAKSAISKILKKLVGTKTSRGHLCWMKGAIPTSLENVTNPSRFRETDKLIHWNRNQINVNRGIVSTTASTAFNNGNATWFYFYRVDGSKIYQVVGTITARGERGNLELVNTNIIKNKTYGIADLGFRLEQEFTDIGLNDTAQSISVSPSNATWVCESPLQSISVSPSSATWICDSSFQSISVSPSSATWICNTSQSISVSPSSATWYILSITTSAPTTTQSNSFDETTTTTVVPTTTTTTTTTVTPTITTTQLDIQSISISPTSGIWNVSPSNI